MPRAFGGRPGVLPRCRVPSRPLLAAVVPNLSRPFPYLSVFLVAAPPSPRSPPKPARLLNRFTPSVPDPPLSFPKAARLRHSTPCLGPTALSLSLVAALSRSSRQTRRGHSASRPFCGIPSPSTASTRQRQPPSQHHPETHPPPPADLSTRHPGTHPTTARLLNTPCRNSPITFASIAISKPLSSQSLRAISIAPSLPHTAPRLGVFPTARGISSSHTCHYFPSSCAFSAASCHPWPICILACHGHFQARPAFSAPTLGHVCPGRPGLFRTCLPSHALRVIPGPPAPWVIYEPVFSGAVRHPRSSAA